MRREDLKIRILKYGPVRFLKNTSSPTLFLFNTLITTLILKILFLRFFLVTSRKLMTSYKDYYDRYSFRTETVLFLPKRFKEISSLYIIFFLKILKKVSEFHDQIDLSY